jgi:anti-sigma-K factor RskA
MSMDADEREYLAAGFALGGLSDADRDLAQQLVETDPDFRRTVAEYEDSLAGLAETDAPLEVSAEAEAAILSIPRAQSPDSDEQAPDSPVSLEALRASRRTWRVLAGVAAAAALIAVVGLGGALLHISGQQRDLDETLAQSQQELERTERLLGAPDVQTHSVDMGDDSGMTVAWSLSEQVFQVRPHGDMQVPDDQVLQLWLIDDAGAHSVGFLADGAVLVDTALVADGALVGVTQEPAGGSEQPTMDPLAVIEL